MDEYVKSLLYLFDEVGLPKGEFMDNFTREMVKSCLLDLENKYQKEPHPFIASDAFFLSMAAGLPVPLWVAEWMHIALKTFCKFEGKKESLQELLGFTSKQRSGTAFDIKGREDRDRQLVYDILVLDHLCMLPNSISRALVLEVHNRTQGATPLNIESFNKYYTKYHREVFDESIERYTRSKDHDFFADFPYDSRLKILLRYIPIALDSQIVNKADLVPKVAALAVQAGVINIDKSVDYAGAILDLLSRIPPAVYSVRYDLLLWAKEELSTQFPPLEN